MLRQQAVEHTLNDYGYLINSQTVGGRNLQILFFYRCSANRTGCFATTKPFLDGLCAKIVLAWRLTNVPDYAKLLVINGTFILRIIFC